MKKKKSNVIRLTLVLSDDRYYYEHPKCPDKKFICSPAVQDHLFGMPAKIRLTLSKKEIAGLKPAALLQHRVATLYGMYHLGAEQIRTLRKLGFGKYFYYEITAT